MTDSAVLLNQIRSVDKGRLVRRLGVLKSETMKEIDRALLVSLGLVEL
jgi:mRNA interferase MazF